MGCAHVRQYNDILLFAGNRSELAIQDSTASAAFAVGTCVTC